MQTEHTEHVQALLAAPAVQIRSFPDTAVWVILQVTDAGRMQLKPAGTGPEADDELLIIHPSQLQPVEPERWARWLAQRGKAPNHEHSADNVDADLPTEEQCAGCMNLWAAREAKRETADRERKVKRRNEWAAGILVRAVAIAQVVRERDDAIEATFDYTASLAPPTDAVIAAVIIADAIGSVEKRLDKIEDRILAIANAIIDRPSGDDR